MKRLIPVLFLSLFQAVSAQASPTNNALFFDADAGVSGFSAPSVTQWTVEFWIYDAFNASAGSEGGVYWCENDGSGIFLETDQTLLYWTPAGATYTSVGKLPLNTWAHVAYTYDGTSLKIYINAVLTNTLSVTGLALPTAPLTMGGSVSGNGLFNLSNVGLDEFRIWNVVRTQQQILNNKAHTLTLPQTGLVRYYTFNQGVSGANNAAFTTLPDITGNGASGTLSRFTLNGASSNWESTTPFTLPLDLLSFQAVNSGSAIKTSWTTANESQVSKYEVERSGDGNSFENAGTVYAQNNKANSYTWTDANPLPGNNYYRLRMIDIDGAFTYSKVVEADLNVNTNAVKIYAGSGSVRAFTVEIGNEAPKGNYNLGVYNMAGAMVYRRQWQHSGTASTETMVLPSSIASGVYTIIVSNGSQRFTQKWVVE